MTKNKEDCFFFFRDTSMGAVGCSYDVDLPWDVCPCENCDKYINHNDVYQIIKEYVDREKSEEEVEE